MKKVKLLYFIILFVILSEQAFSQNNDWELVLNNDDYSLYYDAASYRTANGRIMFIAKREYSEGNILKSEIYWYIFNCSEFQYVLTIYVKKYSDETEETNNYEVEYQDIEKGSEIEILYYTVCPLVPD